MEQDSESGGHKAGLVIKQLIYFVHTMVLAVEKKYSMYIAQKYLCY